MSPLIRDLVWEVLPHFGLEHLGEEAITRDDRHKQFADARAVCMWVARKRTPLSFPEIGREFERNHTTVMSACHKVDRKLVHEPHGLVASVARAILVSFQPDRFELGRDGPSGAREVRLATGLPVSLDLDDSAACIGAAE